MNLTSPRFYLSGLLDEILLTDVARFIQAARQTGLLGITSNGLKGAIYFEHGKIIDVESNEMVGMDALDQLAVFTEGTFEWFDDVAQSTQRLKSYPTGELIKILEVKILEARLMQDVPERPDDPTRPGRAPIPDGFRFGLSKQSSALPGQVAKLIVGMQSLFAKTPTVPKRNTSSTQETKPETNPSDNPLALFKAQDLVQVFCLNGRNIKLAMVCDNGTTGAIYMWRGRVNHAEVAHMMGDEAFYALILAKNPQLSIEELPEEPPISVSTSWERLLMEAAVRRDTELSKTKS